MWQCCDYYGNWYYVSNLDGLFVVIVLACALGYLAWFYFEYLPSKKRPCNCDDCRRKRGELRPLENLPAEYQSPGQDWPFK